MSEYSSVKNTSKSDTLLLTFWLAAPLVVGPILSVTAAVVGSGIGQRMTDLVPFYYNYYGVVIYQGIALSDETMWFVTAVEVDLAQKEPVMCLYNVTISFNDIVITGVQLHKHNDFL